MFMSDYSRHLRDPSLEQQKKLDEKQDKVIERLKENHLTLTDSFNKMIEVLKQKSITPGISLKIAILKKTEIVFTTPTK